MEQKLFYYLNKYPDIDTSVFLAPGVKIIGDVQIDRNSSIWFNSIIRGDVNYIKIGENTNIQDGSILHVTNDKFPLNIGNNITIGHGAKLHGCTLNDLCLIGIGAIVLDGSLVESYSIVAAGAVVTPDFIVPSGKLVAGVPAKIIRNLTENEKKELKHSADMYNKYARITKESLDTKKYL